MKEYVKIRRNKPKYEEICRKYEGICQKYVRICGKYEKICQKYEEICQYIGFGTPTSIWVLGLGKILSTAFI